MDINSLKTFLKTLRQGLENFFREKIKSFENKNVRKTDDEKRRYIRLSTILPITYQIIHSETKKPLDKINQAFTRDISEGGMSLEINDLKDIYVKNLKSGEAEVSLTIEVPFSKKPVAARAKAMWVKEIKEAYPNKYILGINYEDISEPERKKIFKFARFSFWRPKIVTLIICVLIVAALFAGYRVYLEREAKETVQKTVDVLQREKLLGKQIAELNDAKSRVEEELLKATNEQLSIEQQITALSEEEANQVLKEELEKKLEDYKSMTSSLQTELTAIINKLELLNKELGELKGEISEQLEMAARVRVVSVKKENFEDVLPAMGTIRGYVETDLKFGINGSIQSFNFNSGDRVEKGEVIATLEQQDALIKQEYAQLKLEEYQKLYDIGAITESKLKQVQLESELAKLELEKTTLRAPFNGVINNREAEQGKFITINDRIATFSSIDEVVAEIGIIEKDIEKIKLGQKVLIKVDAYQNMEFEGAVDNISSSFEGKSRTLTIRIKIPNQKDLLLPGMFARVIVYVYQKENAVLIPLMSLEKEAGEYQVFVATKDFKAELRTVEVDYIGSESVVVKSGVEENELIIVEKTKEIKDGDTIEIMKE
ncbi:MAG: efflux RND transporter periplasmic adaptor subunit [Candidatus Omnitrophota bacterium]